METCQNCKKQYGYIWRAPDILWEEISGRDDGSGLLCIECFDELSRKKELYLYWECDIKVFPTDKRQ